MVRDGNTGEVKDDEKHVEWYGAIFENDGTKETLMQKIGVHKCTNEDYAKFSPTADQSKKMFERYRNELYCLNNLDTKGRPINKKLFGSSDVMINRTFVLVFSPCIYSEANY